MNERGSALVETLLLGLLLLVPLIWGLTVLSELHSAALATTSAAREAGFDAARATSATEARQRVDAAVARAFIDHGIDPVGARVEYAASLERGGRVQVRVSYDVAVLQAPLLGAVAGPAITVNATHAARVDPYGSRP